MANSTPDIMPMLGLDLHMEDDPEEVYGYGANIIDPMSTFALGTCPLNMTGQSDFYSAFLQP